MNPQPGHQSAAGSGQPSVIETFDAYVAWYVWARSAVSTDAVVCHTAARAAVRAFAAGGDSTVAEAAARAAASDGAALEQTRANYDTGQRYVDWFLWARDHTGRPAVDCHLAAGAAMEALAAGGTQQSAAEAAARAMPPSRRPRP